MTTAADNTRRPGRGKHHPTPAAEHRQRQTSKDGRDTTPAGQRPRRSRHTPDRRRRGGATHTRGRGKGRHEPRLDDDNRRDGKTPTPLTRHGGVTRNRRRGKRRHRPDPDNTTADIGDTAEKTHPPVKRRRRDNTRLPAEEKGRHHPDANDKTGGTNLRTGGRTPPPAAQHRREDAPLTRRRLGEATRTRRRGKGRHRHPGHGSLPHPATGERKTTTASDE